MSIQNLPTLQPGQHYDLVPDHDHLRIFAVPKYSKPDLHAVETLQKIARFVLFGQYPEQWNALKAMAKSISSQYCEKFNSGGGWICNQSTASQLALVQDYYKCIGNVIKMRQENPSSLSIPLSLPSGVKGIIFSHLSFKDKKNIFLCNTLALKLWNTLTSTHYSLLIPNEKFVFVEKNNQLKMETYIKASADDYERAVAFFREMLNYINNDKYAEKWNDFYKAAKGTFFNYRRNILCSLFSNNQSNRINIKSLEKSCKHISQTIKIRRQNLVSPPAVFPIPPELVVHILTLLPPSDLKSTLNLNRMGRSLTYRAALIIAPSLNYRGQKDEIHAYQYLCHISSLIQKLYKQGFLCRDFVIEQQNNINIVSTLQKIKEVNIDQSIYLQSTANYSSALFFLLKQLEQEMQGNSWNEKIAIIKKELQILLDYGMNVNIQDQDGNTPLHLAVSQRYEAKELAEALIQKGANVNQVNNKGETPLHLAVCWEETLKLLIKNGAIVDYQNTLNGYTVFHYFALKLKNNSWLEQTSIENLLKQEAHASTALLKNQQGLSGSQLLSNVRQQSYSTYSSMDREAERRMWRQIHGGAFSSSW